MEARFPDIVNAQPELLAHHYALAGMADKAIDYWLTAGKRATQASANAEAYANLKQGLEQMEALPEGAERDARELDLQMALITPLAVKGTSTPEAIAVSERAIVLCHQTGQVSRIFPALYGQWVHSYAGGDIARASHLAADYLELANSQEESVPRLMGHRLMGTSLLVGGSPTAGLDHLEQAWRLFDPVRDAESALTYTLDFGVIIRCQAGAAGLSGYPDQAAHWIQEAVERARTVEHANSLAGALWTTAVAAFLFGDRTTVARHTAELQPLTEEHRLLNYQAGGIPLQAAVLGWQGQPQEGLEKLDQGVATLANLQNHLHHPVHLLIRVELLRELGREGDALAAIAEGYDFISTSQEHWCDAELHRVRGEISASLSRENEAEVEYTAALAIAREQQARWWELRASVSLAKLWQEQGKITEARELLAPVYDWFTEGFDTADLKEAKALLDELAS
jgi:predicted ATPase